MEESGQTFSLRLCPRACDPTALPRPPLPPPRLCINPPLPGSQGHTGGKKPKEERVGGEIRTRQLGMVFLSPCAHLFYSFRAPHSHFLRALGVSGLRAQLGRTKKAAPSGVSRATLALERHYSARVGCGAETPLSPLQRRAAAPHLRGPPPKP